MMLSITARRAAGAISGVVLPVLLASCSGPSLTVNDRPVGETSSARALTMATALEPGNRKTLRDEDLLGLYQREPAEAISVLTARNSGEPSEARRLALAEMASDTADSLTADSPRTAIGFYLEAARLTAGPALAAALQAEETPDLTLYNYSSARVARIFRAHPELGGDAIVVPGVSSNYSLEVAGGREFANPWSFDLLVPANWLKLDGIRLEPVRQEGLGAAMIGHLEPVSEEGGAEPLMPPFGYTSTLNATLRFSGTRVTLALQDLMVRGRAELEDREVPLAGDFTAALAFMYRDRKFRGRKILATLRPGNFEDSIGLYSIEPFRDDKIPLLLVHGLLSTAEGWFPFANMLREDPVVRERYQMIFFNYPTGNPIGLSARELRAALASCRAHYGFDPPNRFIRETVIIGHSMGGILSNMIIRNSGDRFEKLYFEKPVEELDVDGAERARIEDLIFFDADPSIARAILIAAPHRGSSLASNPIGKLGASLIRLPFDLVDAVLGDVLIIDSLTDVAQKAVEGPHNSVISLRPDNPMLPVVLESEVREGVRKHSIIAQKNPNLPREEGSDGVVPYTSSHLEGVESEAIVLNASHRSVLEKDECIDEVLRILYGHAGLQWTPRRELSQPDPGR
jgi:pimeloyl-ACP methyl ester carboxylesterase